MQDYGCPAARAPFFLALAVVFFSMNGVMRTDVRNRLLVQIIARIPLAEMQVENVKGSLHLL